MICKKQGEETRRTKKKIIKDRAKKKAKTRNGGRVLWQPKNNKEGNDKRKIYHSFKPPSNYVDVNGDETELQ